MTRPGSPVTVAKPLSFSARHIGPDERECEAMLEAVGAATLDELIEQTVPASILDRSPLGLGEPSSESAALARLREMARSNRMSTSLIGQGYHGTFVPAVVQRNILENPAWYTAYTPYQPEISQGRLEALLNFQTVVSDLTGLPVANASLLDEATAAAEAMLLARRVTKGTGGRFFVDEECHPQTIAVLRTRAEPLGIELVVGCPDRDLQPSSVFGGLFQYPGTGGRIRDLRPPIAAVRSAGALAAVAADPLALCILTPPGELGADVAVGSMQRFGVPMGFGGPHAAYMAVRDELKRAMPGRLVGVSIDARGRPAYRLALQTREQHIRREKATSNICTAQVLLAVMSSMYAVHHGPDGLRAIAERVHALTVRLAGACAGLGFVLESDTFFDTLTLRTGVRTDALLAAAEADGINLRRIDGKRVGITLDETSDEALVHRLVRALASVALPVVQAPAEPIRGIPRFAHRSTAYLQHPTFHRYRSETELLRYIRRLSDRDLALDRSMIPLGSCTMKLNATTEMIPVTWPEFGEIHPFAPKEQWAGYAALFAELERQLRAVSGYDAVSLQPNSGAQGELAGLLTIRGYHHARGEPQRDLCLIPASAHGTNPASAHLAGMGVVVVGCDRAGNIDMVDLQAKIDTHRDRLAAIMITYPSTHGVFEEEVVEICRMVHDAGGQVYLDGANLNAQVGLCRPGSFGADVSHFNLHKTFCIPHGGGGPGMGPIGVKAHLAPYLPTPTHGSDGPTVSAAPYGSASILPISYAYMLMMGDEGLRRASEVAILNANYVAVRLAPHYPVLYRGAAGRIAHECILDLRPIKEATGITVEDVAKRLIDYGFHAPTMSFPVPGTLMIEPTESECKAELDRFCDAMIAIREEIRAVERAEMPAADSALRNAPHTLADLLDDDWSRPYTRKHACSPAGFTPDKYWPASNRIDNAFGDKNLVCQCPPLAAYDAEAA